MKKTLIITIILISLSSFLLAQGKSEQAENLWYQNKAKLDTYIKTNHHTSQYELNRFYLFNELIIDSCKRVFFKKFIYSNIDNKDVADYFIFMTTQMDNLFFAFESMEKNNSDLVDKTIFDKKRPTATESTCSSPDNLDFSYGTLLNWDAFYGENSSNSTSHTVINITGTACGPVKAAANDPSTNLSGAKTDYQVTIDSAGYDGILPLLPTVPPGAKYSCRIGDSTNPNQGAALITNQFVLPASTPIIDCQFAFLLENPIGHSYYQQPFFKISIVDSASNIIDSITYSPTTSLYPAFYYAANSDSVYYQTWTNIYFNLSAYIGHCITLQYEVADCSLGGHFGYAYVSSSLSAIPLNANEIENTSQVINIFPNPSNGVFTIQSSVNSGQSTVEIYNVLGQQVYTAKLNTTNTQIDLSNNANGVYLYRVLTETGNSVSQGKFVIQK